MESKLTLGKGWKLVSSIATDEVLVLKALERAKEGEQRFSWLCLDPASGRRVHLPVAAPLGGGGAVAYHKAGGEIVYAGSAGIMSLNLLTKREAVRIPLDHDWNDVCDLWLPPEGSPTLIYVLGEREESRSQLQARAKEAQSGGPFLLRAKYSLHSWDMRTSASRLIARFDSMPVSVAVDWSAGAAYALVENKGKKDLLKIELVSGDASLIRSTDAVDALEISPRHTVLAWRSYSTPRIIETLEDGSERPLTDFGWYPAFSPNGRRFAFTVGDYEVWVKESDNAQPERVVSYPPELSWNMHDRIKWCRCGDHFAVCLAGSRAGVADKRPLMVVDCARKEVRVIDDLVFIGTLGERVWIDQKDSTVGKYLA